MVEIAVLAIQKNSVFHDKCGAGKARKFAGLVTRVVILIEAIDTSNTTALCSQLVSLVSVQGNIIIVFFLSNFDLIFPTAKQHQHIELQ